MRPVWRPGPESDFLDRETVHWLGVHAERVACPRGGGHGRAVTFFLTDSAQPYSVRELHKLTERCIAGACSPPPHTLVAPSGTAPLVCLRPTLPAPSGTAPHGGLLFAHPCSLCQHLSHCAQRKRGSRLGGVSPVVDSNRSPQLAELQIEDSVREESTKSSPSPAGSSSPVRRASWALRSVVAPDSAERRAAR